MNECAQLQAISNQLKAVPSFGSSADGDCCKGPIICDLNRKVIEINLSNHTLAGTLPASLLSFVNLVEINVSDNPALVGNLPALPTGLTYIDVSNTGLSGPVDISFLSKPLMTCRFGSASKVCLKAQTLPLTGCNGIKDLSLCVSTSATVTSSSTSTTIQSETRLPVPTTALAQNSQSPIVSQEQIHLDNSDISTPIIIMWIVAASIMAFSLLICLCILFAHKYGKSSSIGLKRRRGRTSHSTDNEPYTTRIESLPENRTIYESRAERIAERIISQNGERYFPVRKEYSRASPDEMSLSIGDTITLYRVFEDGWAEGVSLRGGKTAYFPLECLGGCVPSLLQDPEIFHIMSESDLESVNSPLPPLLHVTPVFMSPTTAKHTCLPVLGETKQAPESFKKYEKLVDVDSLDGNGNPFAEDIAVENRDYDASYNPFKGSLLNKKSSQDVSFPEKIHSAEASSDFYTNFY